MTRTDRSPTGEQRSWGVDPGARIASIRERSARRRVALVVAIGVGLAVSSVHWTGLVVGGALVGLTRQSVPRALAAGACFGLLVVVAAVGTTLPGSPALLLAASPLPELAAAVAVLASGWGSLARAVV